MSNWSVASKVSLIIIISIVTLSLFAPWIAPFEPQFSDSNKLQVPPVWSQGGSSLHLFGTDDLGRDIFSRIVWGGRVTLLAGFLVVLFSTVFGILLGALAGYFGSWIDNIIMRSMDILLALPSILFAIVVVTVMGQSLINTVIAISVVGLPSFVRIVRASVIAEKQKNYITALKIAGAGKFRIIFNNIIPNCIPTILVQATLTFSDGILNTAALGALGLGVQPPIPEWGTMLADSRSFIESSSWMITIPGLFILFVVVAFNLLGDGLRDLLDPKQKRVRS